MTDYKKLNISSSKKFSIDTLQKYLLDLGIECSIISTRCNSEFIENDVSKLRIEYGCSIHIYNFFEVDNDIVEGSICKLFIAIKNFINNCRGDISCAFVKDGSYEGCIENHPEWNTEYTI